MEGEGPPLLPASHLQEIAPPSLRPDDQFSTMSPPFFAPVGFPSLTSFRDGRERFDSLADDPMALGSSSVSLSSLPVASGKLPPSTREREARKSPTPVLGYGLIRHGFPCTRLRLRLGRPLIDQSSALASRSGPSSSQLPCRTPRLHSAPDSLNPAALSSTWAAPGSSPGLASVRLGRLRQPASASAPCVGLGLFESASASSLGFGLPRPSFLGCHLFSFLLIQAPSKGLRPFRPSLTFRQWVQKHH